MIKFLLYGAPAKEKTISLALLIIRAAAGLLMMTHGWSKIQNFDNMVAGGFDPLGIGTSLSVILLIAAEFVAAIMIVLGLLTRLSAIPLVFAMGVAVFVAHAADPIAVKELAIIYLAVFAGLFFTGAGSFSLDYLLFGKKK
ncbi:MAG: DoxX family protein [Bacteroidetes bacterium HGW-Bacteroidetes-14]|jgi:putative oxidoreductase|nr:MAG: DoxX family protein [Bacteroidetes bacterium HGW-Bacteroidetes-14]